MTALTAAAPRIGSLNRALDRGRLNAERRLARLEQTYERLVRAAGRDAAGMLRAQTLVAAANPDWQPPPEGILVDVDDLRAKAAARLAAEHERILKDAAGPALERIGIAWDVSNPLVQELLAQAAQRTGAALGAAVQPVLRATIADAYTQGLSVVDAASLIRSKIADAAPAQARMLARTDLNGLANGGSVMAAKIAGVGSKVWLTAGDERVRPDHMAANGQAVPIDQPFSVGGEQLAFPGDPAGSDEQVCNCRCTIVYEDAPVSRTAAALSEGGRNMDAMTAAVAAPTRWQAVLAVEGEPTEDGRMLAAGSITWRELPITLMAMTKTGPGGHEGAEAAGRIDEIWRDEGRIMGAGVFDAGGLGGEIARMVREQTLRGVSVDLAVREFEVRILNDDGTAGDAVEGPLDLAEGTDALFVVTDGIIGAATVCPFQSIANARITIVGSSNDAWRLERATEFVFTGPTIDDQIAASLRTLIDVSEIAARADYVEQERDALKRERDELRSLVASQQEAHRRETDAEKQRTLAQIEAMTARFTERKPRELRVLRDDSGRAVGYQEVTA